MNGIIPFKKYLHFKKANKVNDVMSPERKTIDIKKPFKVFVELHASFEISDAVYCRDIPIEEQSEGNF